MRKRIEELLNNSSLVVKIRFSYAMIVLPIFVFLIVSFGYLGRSDMRYEEITNSVSAASAFSVDFQKDYDYETYLEIVGNKAPEDTQIQKLLQEASSVIEELLLVTDNPNNIKKLDSINKYLSNLETYQSRIENNLREGNRYEENMEIWENDVQIVTALIRETMITYIYGEMAELESARAEYRDFYTSMFQIIIILMIILFVLIVAMSYYIPLSITRRLRELCDITDKIAEGDLTVTANVEGEREVVALSNSMNTMIVKINELIDQVTKEQKRLRRSEFELLQAQINPHFLYNTLDAIMWLAETGETKQAVNMVRSLSDFFRTSLNQGKDIISVEEELKHVSSYLEIQHVRYQDILNFTVDVPKELNSYHIPKITLQPLVENALYHGIKNRRGLGEIKITGNTEENYFAIIVEDNGIGMTPERLKQVVDAMNNAKPEEGDIYGLYNVNERIKLNVGEEYGLYISSANGEGTKVEVRLPYS